MVDEFQTVEDFRGFTRDLRVLTQRRSTGPDNRQPMPADKLAERVAIELRGSPLFTDVPSRRGRRRPRLRE